MKLSLIEIPQKHLYVNGKGNFTGDCSVI